MKKSKFIYILLPLIAIALEILPYGAVLNFGVQSDDGSIEIIRETYSYFSLIPFGYANFGCFITAILTSCLLFVGIINLLKSSNRLKNTITIISAIATLTSLSPILFGFSYISFVGVLISVTLSIELIISLKKNNNTNCK